MLNIQEYVNINDYTTLKIGGKFRYFAEVSDVDSIPVIYEYAEKNNVPVMMIGGGSNLVFKDEVTNILAIKVNLLGFEIIKETEYYTEIKIGAGEKWDATVARTVDMNLAGIEAMSLIPGTVGATPVQNVGAYGQEIKDTLVSVEVYDKSDKSIKQLSNAQCMFGYRDSIFKHNAKDKYLIVSITLRLSKTAPQAPDYPGVKKYFSEQGISNPTLLDIRNAIISIRNTKLPNPKDIPNVGSFFKNPIVPKSLSLGLAIEFPNLVTFPVNDLNVKIPAGWLIENAGLKGKSFGAVSIYSQNALVLVNNGDATFADIAAARDYIINAVKVKFGITLETEPEFI